MSRTVGSGSQRAVVVLLASVLLGLAGCAKSVPPSATEAVGTQAKLIETSRLKVHALVHGRSDGTPVVFLHGNFSSGGFFREVLDGLPPELYAIAPDLRGFGGTEDKPVDATRGLKDMSDDVDALLVALGLAEKPVHLVGWSMGGAAAMQYTVDRPQRVASLTLIAPVSPYGFLGTRDENGTPTMADYAGAGAGCIAPEFQQRIVKKDASAESPFSPRNTMNSFYFAPPFRVSKEFEDYLVAEILKSRIGDGFNPGTVEKTANWPGFAPGAAGILNAFSGKYLNLSGLAAINPKPKILWVRGSADQVVSDNSAWDVGVLGAAKFIPNWPGAEAYPPQPMVKQTRAVLEKYKAAGGEYREVVLDGAGHAPFIEKKAEFLELLLPFVKS